MRHLIRSGHHSSPLASRTSTGPFVAATGLCLDATVNGRRSFDINTDGVAHVGMLPDLLAEFEAMGLTHVDLEPPAPLSRRLCRGVGEGLEPIP